MTAPVDNLVRAWAGPEATAVRADGETGGTTMVGHFAVFDQWTEINSTFEGRFLEKIAPGAFTDTFKQRGDRIRVLYDHGADPSIGNKPLGAATVLREDRIGAYYEVPLFDAGYVNDLKPAIRAGQLGASFRFKVTSEQWNDPAEATAANPERLPERSITGAEVYEFGPVTFPAYPDASAGMRSRTDEFLEHFLNDPAFVARFRERVGPQVVDQIRASLPPTVEPAEPTEPPTAPVAPDVRADGTTDETDSEHQRRLAHWRRLTAPFDAHIQRLSRETTL